MGTLTQTIEIIDLEREVADLKRRLNISRRSQERQQRIIERLKEKLAGAPQRDWLTINEAARYIKVARRTIYNMIQRGLIAVERTASGQPRIYAPSLWHTERPDLVSLRERQQQTLIADYLKTYRA